MSKSIDYLKDARVHELIGGVFGWLWIIGSGVAFVWFIGALFGSWSWWVVIASFLGSLFMKSVARQYNLASQKAIQDGVAVGQLFIDENNRAWSKLSAVERR